MTKIIFKGSRVVNRIAIVRSVLVSPKPSGSGPIHLLLTACRRALRSDPISADCLHYLFSSIVFYDRDPDLTVEAIACRRLAPEGESHKSKAFVGVRDSQAARRRKASCESRLSPLRGSNQSTHRRNPRLAKPRLGLNSGRCFAARWRIVFRRNPRLAKPRLGLDSGRPDESRLGE